MFPSSEDENLDGKFSQWLEAAPDGKVFEWFGNDSDNVPNYMRLLGLYLNEDDINSDLKLFRDVAQKLRNEPEYFRQMIRTSFWRHTLVASISVILLEAEEFCDDLEKGFDLPNFVSPQIAVALGLICPRKAVSFLKEAVSKAEPIPSAENFKRDWSIHTDSKRIVAAQTVLSKLDYKSAKMLSNSVVFQEHSKNLDGVTGRVAAENHWEFWLNTIKKQNPNSYWNHNKSLYRKLRDLLWHRG